MIVVTGGAGFIGSAFVWKLNEEGIDDIWVVDILGDPAKERNLAKRKYKQLISRDDFIHRVRHSELPSSITAIVHMGACSSTTETNVEFLTENNFKYTQTLALWAIERNVRFIYASSAATYGVGRDGYSDDHARIQKLHPMNPYGVSKQQFDVWALENNVLGRIVGLKFFNVYGPNEYHKGDMLSVVYKAYHQILQTGKVRLFKSYHPDYRDGEQQRDFIYVKDCVDVIYGLLDNKNINGIFNLGTGKARMWNDLVNAVFSSMGREANIEYIEMPETLRSQYQYFTEADMGKLRSSGFGVPFHSLEDGVRDYVKSYLMQSDTYL